MKKAVFFCVLAALLLAGSLTGGYFIWKSRPLGTLPEISAAYLEQNRKKEDYARLHHLLEGKEPLTWLFAGDSITQGCGHTAYRRNFSEYFEQCIQSARADDIVVNTGVSSATTKDMDERFDAWITAPGANVAFLCFGTNDCTAPGMTVEQFRQNLIRAVDALEKSGAIPILQTPNAGARESSIKPYLNAVRALADERGLLLVDVNSYWHAHPLAAKKLMSDGLHPNAEGHYAWARLLLNSLGMEEQGQGLAQLSIAKLSDGLPQTKWPEAPAVNAAAREKLQPFIDNTASAVWVFAGGTKTEPSPASSRSYVQHAQEILRWELFTASADIGKRSKAFVDVQQQGCTVSNLLGRYEERIGRFRPQVLSILPDAAEAGPDFAAHLTALVKKAQSQGAVVLLQTPFAQGSEAQEVRTAMLDVARSCNAALIDHTALLETAGDCTSFWNGGKRTAAGEFVLARQLCASLVQLPEGSRMG